jgi:hypothetical protein
VARLDGTTPWAVLTAILKRLVDEGVVTAPTGAWISLDPDILPEKSPSADRFVTVAIDELAWDGAGDAGLNESTGLDGAQLVVQGDVLTTFWLRHEHDLAGHADALLLKDALPPGTGFIEKGMAALYQHDLKDAAGKLILMRPMIFKALIGPSSWKNDGTPWRPFRFVHDVMFTWELG